MQVNSSHLTAAHSTTKVDVNKAVSHIGTNAADSVETSLPIAAQSLTINAYQEDAAALQSRLGAHVEYENQTAGQRGAVAEYLIHQHAAKREEIQQMVGIDTYA
ncbi:hypothetical protein MSG37_10195 [Shewanella sp. 1CM18E]|uniref:hypothetical protein n=1 Tax=Shewanella sp. 1CM18E TaxID=2929169 RepID=UPI0020BF5B45|nr:hypothetical protein [Shewanella sp. 1CM18E]MCK8045259.1 hypothetical protein [Shewanella sp. 1CM18E]